MRAVKSTPPGVTVVDLDAPEEGGGFPLGVVGSIWSLGVHRHGGRGHRLTLAGERFVGLASEDAAAFSIFFPMD